MMMGEIKDSSREMGKSQSDYATLNEVNDGGGGATISQKPQMSIKIRRLEPNFNYLSLCACED